VDIIRPAFIRRYVIWIGYSMSAVVAGGYYSAPEARYLVFQISIITATLLTLGAVPVAWKQNFKSRLRVFGRTVLFTAIPLFVYASVVVCWRQCWTPAKGMNEFAQFGPVVGHVNAAFFSEFHFLSYLLFVLPILSVFAGTLSVLYVSWLQSKPNRPSF
jgi:hypothetical protein